MAGTVLTQADFNQACAEQHPRYPLARNDKNPGEPPAYRMKCYNAAGHITPAPSLEYSGVALDDYCPGALVSRNPDIWAPDALKHWSCENPPGTA